MVPHLEIMVVAVILSVIVMLVFAAPVGDFVEEHPSIKILALSFLVMIGVLLVAEGTGQHFERGYVYFAMIFSLGIELLNMRYRARQAHTSETWLTRFSDHLDHELPGAWAGVEIDENDLLPGTERQLVIDERDGERRAEHRRTYVAMSVVVAPPLMVPILHRLRVEALERGDEIVNESGLVLDGRQPRGRAGHEDGRHPLVQLRIAHSLGDIRGDIENVPVAARIERPTNGGHSHERPL